MFSLLSKPIDPPMASVRPFAMVVPSPVPPCLRDRLLSACSKASNNLARAAAGMPMPVSVTVKRRRCRVADGISASDTCSRTSPDGVNLIALLSRLTSTWRRWPGSPRNRVATSGATSTM